MFRRATFDQVRFTAFLEQEPDPSNRITLSRRTDIFGRPLPRLIYRDSDFMLRSHRRTLELMAAAFSAKGFGRLRHGDEAIAHLSAYDRYGLHQMGSTRMAALAARLGDHLAQKLRPSSVSSSTHQNGSER